MIDLYFWPTPNGYKPLIFCEEAGIEYQIKAVNIMRGDQFRPEFSKISPNHKMPALVDHDPDLAEADRPFSIFESGAMLIYLAEKTGKFLPQGRARYDVLQWVLWQSSGLGPMKGQAHHFFRYADEDVPYAKKRYRRETLRLIGVLDRQLRDYDYIAGDQYSIADMMSYPWLRNFEGLDISLDDFLNVKDWVERIENRPAVKRAYQIGEKLRENEPLDDTAKSILFGSAGYR